MPKKLDDEVQHLHLIAPTAWVKKINAWQQQQDAPVNLSAAIRRLVEIGLETAAKKKGPRRT